MFPLVTAIQGQLVIVVTLGDPVPVLMCRGLWVRSKKVFWTTRCNTFNVTNNIAPTTDISSNFTKSEYGCSDIAQTLGVWRSSKAKIEPAQNVERSKISSCLSLCDSDWKLISWRSCSDAPSTLIIHSKSITNFVCLGDKTVWPTPLPRRPSAWKIQLGLAHNDMVRTDTLCYVTWLQLPASLPVETQQQFRAEMLV